MISYAQNQEDVVLYRLTKQVKTGIYIDVGAAHPILENVTYALYLEGWRGINVEPMAREAELLREIRPEDETVMAAIGESHGKVTLYEAPIENRGATTADLDFVLKYRGLGQDFKPFEAEVVTLDSLLSKYPIGGVHIIKIDVEGHEKAAILGSNLFQHRPWVLVIEATKPNSTEDASYEWEPLLVNAGYVCVLFDGLNKYFVRGDLSDIQELLATPANVFDNWQDYRIAIAEEYAASLSTTLELKNFEIFEAKKYIESLEDHLTMSKKQYEKLHHYTEEMLRSMNKIEQ